MEEFEIVIRLEFIGNSYIEIHPPILISNDNISCDVERWVGWMNKSGSVERDGCQFGEAVCYIGPLENPTGFGIFADLVGHGDSPKQGLLRLFIPGFKNDILERGAAMFDRQA